MWNGITTSLKTTWESLKTTAKTTFDGLKTNVEGVWNSLKTTTSTLWNGITTSLKTAWEGLKTTAKTSFDGLKTNIEGTWNAVKTTTSTVWGNIKTDLNSAWDGLKTTAKTKFDGMKANVEGAWNSVKTATTSVWNSIKGELTGAWENMTSTSVSKSNEMNNNISRAWDNIKNTAANKFSEMGYEISRTWDDIRSSASRWGSDICDNLASGIQWGIGKVTAAAQSVASSISSYLHFSEPDVGPLSNFHVFMPDMMKLMEQGIRQNSYRPIAAVQDLTSSIAGMFSGTQTMALSLDTSALGYYDPQRFASSITADVETHTDASDLSFREAMADFYREYVQPTMNQLADDMRRQADKEERPVVQIGNRVITDTVEEQRKANGYQFVK